MDHTESSTVDVYGPAF